MLEGGVWGGDSLPGTAAVSKHEKKSVTQLQGACLRGAVVSKHETGTVTKQTTGALQFMVAFALRGGGGEGLANVREYISLRCALGGGRSVPEPARL